MPDDVAVYATASTAAVTRDEIAAYATASTTTVVRDDVAVYATASTAAAGMSYITSVWSFDSSCRLCRVRVSHEQLPATVY